MGSKTKKAAGAGAKTKRASRVVSIFLTIVFVIGTLIVGILVSQFRNQLQASALSISGGAPKIALNSDQMKRRSARTRALLAQLVIPQEILNPLTVCMYVPPAKPEYKGEFVTKELELWSEEGGEFETTLYIKNTGNTAWFGDSSGCTGMNYLRLGTAKERDHESIFYNPGDPRWVAPNRIAMVEPRVDPGMIGTFRFNSKAPKTSDIFREYFQPILEAKQWLDTGEATARVDVFVGEVPEGYEDALFYLGGTGQASSIDPTGQLLIDIDISEQKMQVFLGSQKIREYTVSTGTFKTPTPLGRFEILNKQELRIGGKAPHYRMPSWQGFTKWGHGLHALPYLATDRGVFWNEALNHIGQRVSHGCVRILPDDAKDLYAITQVGAPIVIHE